jgi:hypothetical protein
MPDDPPHRFKVGDKVRLSDRYIRARKMAGTPLVHGTVIELTPPQNGYATVKVHWVPYVPGDTVPPYTVVYLESYLERTTWA